MHHAALGLIVYLTTYPTAVKPLWVKHTRIATVDLSVEQNSGHFLAL